jgi:hypothetical protein
MPPKGPKSTLLSSLQDLQIDALNVGDAQKYLKKTRERLCASKSDGEKNLLKQFKEALQKQIEILRRGANSQVDEELAKVEALAQQVKDRASSARGHNRIQDQAAAAQTEGAEDGASPAAQVFRAFLKLVAGVDIPKLGPISHMGS